MRIHGFIRRDFTADLWDFEERFGSGSDVTLDYSFSKVIPIYFSTDPNSPRQMAYINEPVRRRARLLNIKDKDGFRIMGDAQYEITAMEPIINSFRQREGWRCSLALVGEVTFDELDRGRQV